MNVTSQTCSPTWVTDALAGKDVTHVDLAAVDADPAAVGHGERRIRKWVADVLKAAVEARRPELTNDDVVDIAVPLTRR